MSLNLYHLSEEELKQGAEIFARLSQIRANNRANIQLIHHPYSKETLIQFHLATLAIQVLLSTQNKREEMIQNQLNDIIKEF